MSRTVDDTSTSLAPGQGRDARADVHGHPGDIFFKSPRTSTSPA